MKKPANGKFKRTPRPSAAVIAIGTRALARYNAISASLPKCGARAKTTGEPCRQIAMANGRCYCHGGKTPSENEWHRTQWPKRSAPDAEQKLGRKLKAAEKASKKRARRLAEMTSEERQRHEEWHRTHRPGPSSARAAARDRRQRAREAAASFSQGVQRTPDPEIERIQRQIDELERQLVSRQASIFD
ncbi:MULTISPECIES: hypothetical protein [unclassified Shinella]|uniref:hypothetical protein n=1 Tax=unclassified Shinella TaxID=2643062 RepID=UPI00234EF1C8|nr:MULTISPECIES: hypothetical protein [unclassified Shinella]MCO5139948.1 hypothetical protein [Shinella sp.]MDC7257037.1 hypothetical protein [Shinella sp. YE25]